MAFDFPASPTVNQVFTPVGGPSYTWNGVAWDAFAGPAVTTLRAARNRVVNGAMQITQEFARGASLTLTDNYFADQWIASFTGDGTVTYANIGNTFLGLDAGPYCGTVVVGTADTSLTTNQYLVFYQAVEGMRVADFNYGTASALPSVLRFKATSSVALTFAVSLRNSALNRSFVKNLTIAANTPTWFTVPIPGDTTGTWLNDTGIGFRLAVTLGSGPSWHAATEGWSAGNFFATAATSNFWATAGARFSIGAVGLYLDDQNTGIAPRWEMPDYADELIACKRYYNWLNVYWSGYSTVSVTCYAAAGFSTDFRTPPALSGINNAASGFPAAFGSFSTLGTNGAVEGRLANATGAGAVFATTIIGNARI